MKVRLPSKLPHLNAAITKVAYPNPSKGMCFHRSVGFVLDVPPAKLCVGTFRGANEEELLTVANASPVPFIHCWAEIGDKVYAPTTIEAQGGRLMPFNRTEYYTKNGTRDVYRLSRQELRQLSETYGLARHLLYDEPVRGDVGFAIVILDALGVSHTTSADGGIVPGGNDEPLPLYLRRQD